MRGFTQLKSLMAIIMLLLCQFAHADYCTLTDPIEVEVALETIHLTDNVNDIYIEVKDTESVNGTPYFDKTNQVFTTTAGATITPTIEIADVRILHGMLFLDTNNDEEFVSDINTSSYTPNQFSELIAYSAYKFVYGYVDFYNHIGEASYVGDDADELKEFTIPRYMAPGEYRARFNVGYGVFYPCSLVYLYNPGIASVDFTIKIEAMAQARTVTPVSSNEAVGTVSGGGTSSELITCTAIPNEGSEFKYWTDENGAIICRDLTYYDYMGGDHTVIANFEDTYKIETIVGDHGTITLSKDEVVAYEVVTFSITPETGYYIDKLIYNGEDITSLIIKPGSGGITPTYACTVTQRYDPYNEDTPVLYTGVIYWITSPQTIEITFTEICKSEALTPPVQINLATDATGFCWTIIDANNDNVSFLYDTSTSGSVSKGYYYSSTYATSEADDWLISPKIKITNGVVAYVESSSSDMELYALSSPEDYESAILIPYYSMLEIDGEYRHSANLSIFEGEELHVGIKCKQKAGTGELAVYQANVYIPNFTIATDVVWSGTATVNGAELLEDVEVNTALLFEATPNEGFIFDKWTDQYGTTISAKNPYTYYANRDLTLTANFALENSRRVTVGCNIWGRGEQTILSPEIEDGASKTEVTTNQAVYVTTQPVSDVFIFDNWTDQDGNILSTENSYTYMGVEAVDLIANYSAKYKVEYTSIGDGTIAVTANGVAIQSNNSIDENVTINIKAQPNEVETLQYILLNNVNILPNYNTENGYSFTLTESVKIIAKYGDAPELLTIYPTTNGSIEVWSDVIVDSTGDATPSGEEYFDGTYLDFDTPLYIFATADDGYMLESLIINDNEYCNYILNGDKYIEYYTKSITEITTIFSQIPTGIDTQTTDIVKVFGSKGKLTIYTPTEQTASIYTPTGTLVTTKNIVNTTQIPLNPGIYIVRIGSATYKVIVK